MKKQKKYVKSYYDTRITNLSKPFFFSHFSKKKKKTISRKSIYKSNQRSAKKKATATSTTTAVDINRSTASHLRPISLNNDLTNIGNKLHCMPGYDLIPNSPESATLYDENSLISTRPDSLENILFETNKKIGIIDDTYCVMNELDCFGNEENRNLQIGIDDMYQQITDIDDPKLIKATFTDDTKLNEPKYHTYELENIHEILSVDANLNSASRSYLKCNTSMNMTGGNQYYTTIANQLNGNNNSNNNQATTNSNQLIQNSNKTINSTNKQFSIDTTNQYLVKMPPTTTQTLLTTIANGIGGGGVGGGGGNIITAATAPITTENSMIGKLMSQPIGINMNYPDDFNVVGNDFDMGFDLNSYDIDEAASSSSGSHLAFSCTDPNILSDIPSRYLTTFNNIQNETI